MKVSFEVSFPRSVSIQLEDFFEVIKNFQKSLLLFELFFEKNCPTQFTETINRN